MYKPPSNIQQQIVNELVDVLHHDALQGPKARLHQLATQRMNQIEQANKSINPHRYLWDETNGFSSFQMLECKKKMLYYYLMNIIGSTGNYSFCHRRNYFEGDPEIAINTNVMDEACDYELEWIPLKDFKITFNDAEAGNYYLKYKNIPYYDSEVTLHILECDKFLWEYLEELGFKLLVRNEYQMQLCLSYSHWKDK